MCLNPRFSYVSSLRQVVYDRRKGGPRLCLDLLYEMRKPASVCAWTAGCLTMPANTAWLSGGAKACP